MTKVVLVCVMLGLVVSKIAMAVVTSQQAEEIFNLAEQVFPQYFSPTLTTQTFPPDWQYYRGPYNNNIFAGINADDSVYVVGGTFGNSPVNVGTNQEVLALLQNNGNSSSSSSSICNTTGTPDGINYSQNGNVVNVSTNGCIALPANQNLCSAASSSSSSTPPATGISVLTDTNVLSFEFNGISSTDQDILDALSSSASSASSFCTIHAPVDFAPATINLDVCFDVTNQFSQLSTSDLITITPPVTSMVNSTQTNSVVGDCFSTGAQTITNTVTKEIWTLQNGSYVKTSDV